MINDYECSVKEKKYDQPRNIKNRDGAIRY